MNRNELTMTGLGSKLSSEVNRSLGLTNSMLASISVQRDIMDRIMPDRNLFNTNKIASVMTNSLSRLSNPAGIGSIAQMMQNQFKLVMPEETASVMGMIAKQHQQISGMANSIFNMTTAGATLGQMSNLRYAIQNITGRIAGIATLQHRWDLIDDFEQISSQVIELTESIDSEVGMTEENSKSFQDLLDFVYGIVRKHKMIGIYSILFVDMVLRVASFHQYYDFLKPKPDGATKADLQKFETKIFRAIQEKLKSEKEYRRTNRICRIYLKPRSKSIVLKRLAKNTDVVVLQIKGAWIYISYFDTEDNLSLSGWIMKKYLSKPRG